MTSSESPETTGPPSITTVLFDCDGVLQSEHGGHGRRFRPLVGDEADELEDLIGEAQLAAQCDVRDFHDIIAGLVRAKGWHVDPEQIVQVHVDIDRHEAGHVVAAELREAGVRVGLATNQHRRRAEHMRNGLGYDALFDESFYSCDLGYAKPDPRFFTSIVERLGGSTDGVLFVDDRLYHVESARSVGLEAIHWHYEEGTDTLREQLASYGLPVRRSPSSSPA